MTTYRKKLVDDYAEVCAQIASLEAWKKELRTALLGHERPVYEGHVHRVALTVGTRSTLNRKAIESDVGDIPAAWLKASVVKTLKVLT